MTTVAKRRGLVGRWIARLFGMDDDSITEKITAVLNALVWQETAPCISCRTPIPTNANYCEWCGVIQKQKQSNKEDTQPMYAIKLGNEQMVFKQNQTGKLLLNGERPVKAYSKQMQHMKNDSDGWTR
jgi:hypothetical protein